MKLLPPSIAALFIVCSTGLNLLPGVSAAPLDRFETDGPIDVSVSHLSGGPKIGERIYSTNPKNQMISIEGGLRHSNAFYHIQNDYFLHGPNQQQSSGHEINEASSTAIIPCLLAGQSGSRHYRVTYTDMRGANATGSILLGNFAFELSSASSAKRVVIRLYTRVKRSARYRRARIPAALRASYNPAGRTTAPFVPSVDTLKTDVAKVITVSDADPRPTPTSAGPRGASTNARGGHATFPD